MIDNFRLLAVYSKFIRWKGQSPKQGDSIKCPLYKFDKDLYELKECKYLNSFVCIVNEFKEKSKNFFYLFNFNF